MSTATADLVELQVQTPIDGVFVLNRSQLDGPDVLATGAMSGYEWTPVLCDATTVRTRRGGTRDGVTTTIDVGTLAATFIDGVDPTADPNWRPGVATRLVTTDTGEPIFTGTTADFAVSYDKTTDHAYVTMTGTDAVQPLANTPRYGAANPVQEWEGWERRAERLLVSSPVPWASPAEPVNTPVLALVLDGMPLTSWSALPDGEATAWTGGPGVITKPGGPPWFISRVTTWRGSLVRRTTSGFVPGQHYRVTIDADPQADTTFYVDDTPVLTWVDPTPGTGDFADGDRQLFTFDFLATSTTHQIGFITPGAGDLIGLALHGMQVQPLTSVQCANVVYESTLASHLDLVANTAQVGWYVDRRGVVRFTSPLDAAPAAIVHLSDVHDPDDPLHVCYLRTDVTYDTRGLVSDLTLSNHARAWDPDAGGWRADDRTLGPYRDEVAGATWGRRRASLETCVADIPGTVWADSARDLAAGVLDTYAQPRVVIRRVVVDLIDRPALATELDVFSRVEVTHRGVHQTARVVAIEHEMTPTTWTLTLDLMEDF